MYMCIVLMYLYYHLLVTTCPIYSCVSINNYVCCGAGMMCSNISLIFTDVFVPRQGNIDIMSTCHAIVSGIAGNFCLLLKTSSFREDHFHL